MKTQVHRAEVKKLHPQRCFPTFSAFALLIALDIMVEGFFKVTLGAQALISALELNDTALMEKE